MATTPEERLAQVCKAMEQVSGHTRYYALNEERLQLKAAIRSSRIEGIDMKVPFCFRCCSYMKEIVCSRCRRSHSRVNPDRGEGGT